MEKNENPHKKTLIILDILMIVGVLSNFGALACTNYLVAKTKPEIKFVEVNPVAAKVYNLEQAPKPERFSLLKELGKKLIHIFVMGLALGVYIWMRKKAYHPRDYLILSVSVSVWFTILFLNFANDFGFLLAKLF